MENYTEAMIVVFVCLSILFIAMVGIFIYFISEIRKESKIERMKTNILIESMIEIFESKYDLYDKDEDSGSIPRRE